MSCEDIAQKRATLEAVTMDCDSSAIKNKIPEIKGTWNIEAEAEEIAQKIMSGCQEYAKRGLLRVNGNDTCSATTKIFLG